MTDLLESHENLPEIIEGLAASVEVYDAYILDIFGVLHNGVALYEETVPCLENLKKAGKEVCLVSNTPRRRHEVRGDLEKMGLNPALYTGIVTAGDSAFKALKDYEGQRCWFAGTERFSSLLEGLGIELADGPGEADFILNAISGTYPLAEEEIYKELDKALERGLPMVCANPDLVVNKGDEMHICAGTYAVYYEDHGGHVSYHGKPHPPVYEEARAILGSPEKSSILAVGDSLGTDIQGANRFGIPSVFNLVGIHWEEVMMDHQPGEADIDKVRVMIDSQPHKPDAVLCGLSW